MDKKNIIFNMTLEQYNKRYRNRRGHLLKFTKNEVNEFSKKNNVDYKFFLESRKWALINDTYYEIPKPIRLTWFRNLNACVQASVCLLGAGVVATAITVPTVIAINKNKTAEVTVELIEGTTGITIASTKKLDNGALEITLKPEAGKEIASIDKVVIGNQELRINTDYTLVGNVITINKDVIEKHKGEKIIITPKVQDAFDPTKEFESDSEFCDVLFKEKAGTDFVYEISIKNDYKTIKELEEAMEYVKVGDYILVTTPTPEYIVAKSEDKLLLTIRGDVFNTHKGKIKIKAKVKDQKSDKDKFLEAYKTISDNFQASEREYNDIDDFELVDSEDKITDCSYSDTTPRTFKVNINGAEFVMGGGDFIYNDDDTSGIKKIIKDAEGEGKTISYDSDLEDGVIGLTIKDAGGTTTAEYKFNKNGYLTTNNDGSTNIVVKYLREVPTENKYFYFNEVKDLKTKSTLIGYSISKNGSAGELPEDLTIPSKYNGYPVIEIHKYGFRDDLNIKSINYPSSIKTFDEECFFGCFNLCRLNSNTDGDFVFEKTLKTIHGGSFYSTKVKKCYFKSDKTDFISNPFYIQGKEELETLMFYDDITNLYYLRNYYGGQNNYYMALHKGPDYSRKNVTFNGMCKAICGSIFSRDENIESVVFSNSINVISPDAFLLSTLKYATFDDIIYPWDLDETLAGGGYFYDHTFYIPSNNAEANALLLKNKNTDEGYSDYAWKKYLPTEDKYFNFTLNADGKSYSAKLNDSLNEYPLDITIPMVYNGKPVTEIAKDGYKDSKIESITILNSIKKISTGAFKNCLSLKNVYISNREWTLFGSNSTEINVKTSTSKEIADFLINRCNESFENAVAHQFDDGYIMLSNYKFKKGESYKLKYNTKSGTNENAIFGYILSSSDYDKLFNDLNVTFNGEPITVNKYQDPAYEQYGFYFNQITQEGVMLVSFIPSDDVIISQGFMLADYSQ